MQMLRSRKTVAALLAAVVLGGGVATVTPAGAVVADAAATNWKKVWKKKLRPEADKRYYTKAQSDTAYSSKAETAAALGNYYTKAQSDGKYAGAGSSYTKAESDAKYPAAGSSYTKAESDAKYAPQTQLLRGHYLADVPSGVNVTTSISFGVTFSAAPTAHYIPLGGTPPEGCSGDSTLPNAAPGHLCVFPTASSSNVSTLNVFGTTAYGAFLFGQVNSSGSPSYIQGTWAARPAAVVAPTLTGAKDAQAPEGWSSGR